MAYLLFGYPALRGAFASSHVAHWCEVLVYWVSSTKRAFRTRAVLKYPLYAASTAPDDYNAYSNRTCWSSNIRREQPTASMRVRSGYMVEEIGTHPCIYGPLLRPL